MATSDDNLCLTCHQQWCVCEPDYPVPSIISAEDLARAKSCGCEDKHPGKTHYEWFIEQKLCKPRPAQGRRQT